MHVNQASRRRRSRGGTASALTAGTLKEALLFVVVAVVLFVCLFLFFFVCLFAVLIERTLGRSQEIRMSVLRGPLR